MAIYRKGDDQFELRHKAFLQDQEFDYPKTVRLLLNNSENTIQNVQGKVGVWTPADPDEHYKDDFGNPITITHGGGNIMDELPVSGSDIARLKRGK